MTHDDDSSNVVLLNSGSEYLKNYQKSVDSWIDSFVAEQEQHVLSIFRSRIKSSEQDSSNSTSIEHPTI